MKTFVYLRDGDRIGAPIHRMLSNSVMLLDTPMKRLELPEGADTLTFRQERETAGVEFRYRLVSFLDWFKAQESHTVEKWLGKHASSVYPVAPEGTFWSEHPTIDGQPWTLSLLSLETGEPVEGFEAMVEDAKNALIERSQSKAEKQAAAEPQEAAGEAEATDTTEDTTEAVKDEASDAGASTDEATA